MLKKKDAAGAAKKEKTKKEKAKKEKLKKQPREKSEEYILRKNTAMRIMRIALWGMLIFVFIRGVSTCMKKDSVAQAQAVINEFEGKFAEYKDDNEEIMSFSQNFAREYLTYEQRQESDYAERIRRYVSKEIYERASDLVDFQGKATAVYAQAYRKEEYAENQYDIYVLADVEYETEVKTEKNGETETSVTVMRKPVTLKIPVYSDEGKYVVEGLPVIVSDSMQLTGYSAEAYSGTAITDARVNGIRTSVTNFLTAYYDQDQNVIEYYLTKDADKTKFQGLSGRYTFYQIETINCYALDSGILCIVSFTVTDSANGNHLLQELNLLVTADGDKYYIKNMNTKTAHL